MHLDSQAIRADKASEQFLVEAYAIVGTTRINTNNDKWRVTCNTCSIRCNLLLYSFLTVSFGKFYCPLSLLPINKKKGGFTKMVYR